MRTLSICSTDGAYRRLCAKLFLKAETQQVDRILVEFSRRYFECNPTSIYGSASACPSSFPASQLTLHTGVVHAVSYSLLLLNTDLHVADLVTRMSRSQFVRNTLSAIQMQLHPERYNNASTPDLTSDDSSSVRALGADGSVRVVRGPKRSGSIASWSSVTKDLAGAQGDSDGTVTTPAEETPPQSGMASSTSSLQPVSAREPKSPQRSPSSSTVYDRNWENEMENMLKVSCSTTTMREFF